MPRRRAAGAALVLLAVGSLSACTAADRGTATAPTSSPSPTAPVVQEDVGAVPLAHGAGYADAVAVFGGAEEVSAAATTAARVAHIALADCHRWRTGAMDPRLGELLAPALLDRVTEELQRPRGTVTSLLTHLPRDDGNGHRLAADIVLGCDGSAPLRYYMGPLSVRVGVADGTQVLVLTGSFVMDVAFGDTRVQAAQDWVFSAERAGDGWRLSDAATEAHVNWAPPRPG